MINRSTVWFAWRRALTRYISTSRSRLAGLAPSKRVLLPLQYGELVAQDQDLCGLPRLLAPGQPQPRGDPRDQQEDKPQAHDRRSSRPGDWEATLLVRAMDGILGTHGRGGRRAAVPGPGVRDRYRQGRHD